MHTHDNPVVTYKIGFTGLPALEHEFGFVHQKGEWVPMNWRHATIASSGAVFGTTVAGKSAPFFKRGAHAYPIMESASEDFYRAGYVGTLKRRESAGFNEFFNAIAANADAIWIPGNLWEEIRTKTCNRHNFKHWLRESTNTNEIMRGYIARLGRTRIYTDAFANSWAEQFLNDGMYVLKIHDDVERCADPLAEHRVVIVDSAKKGKRLMMEKDLSEQITGIFDLLDRCPPSHIRSGPNWDKLLQE